MGSPPEVVVAARTDTLAACALVLAVLRTPAHADPSDAEILGEDPGWSVESVELRSSFLDQRGRGFQVQGGGPGQPGSERMYVFQPSALIRLRQSARVTHEVTVPVDAITAASPDAVDATSSASRRNTSVDVDVRSTVILGDVETLTTRVAGHWEEPMGSGTLGAGYRRSLADDNATIGINGSLTIDGFDDHDRTGRYLGKTARETFSASITGSQLLSPTTMLDGSYGLTRQHGRLETTWNAVPTEDGNVTDEVLPRDRTRQAATVRIAQHVPITRSTLKGSYRYYRDDLGLRAHTVEGAYYQYLTPWLYARGSYRYHHQRGAEFFTTSLPLGFTGDDPRTADSDLASMHANEWTVQLSTLRERGPLCAWSVSAELMRYTRSNDLRITVVSITVGRAL